jgi:hypothetical protein
MEVILAKGGEKLPFQAGVPQRSSQPDKAAKAGRFASGVRQQRL